MLPFSVRISRAFVTTVLAVVNCSVGSAIIIFSHVHRAVNLCPGHSHCRIVGSTLGSALSHAFGASLAALMIMLYVFVLNNTAVHDFAFTVLLNVVVNACSALFITAPVTCRLRGGGVGGGTTTRTNGWR